MTFAAETSLTKALPVGGCPMSQEPDLHIRNDPFSGIMPMLIGGLVGGGWILVLLYGLGVMIDRRELQIGFFLAAVLGLAIGGFALRAFAKGWNHFFDKSPKLTFSAEGLTDHRTQTFIEWKEFLGVRLYVETTNGNLTSATMYIKVWKSFGNPEISFGVAHLDRPHKEIADLVQRRGLAATS